MTDDGDRPGRTIDERARDALVEAVNESARRRVYGRTAPSGGVPVTPTDPHEVFTWLPRQKRAEYVKAMHGTLAVQKRDLDRALAVVGRELARPLVWLVRRLR